MYQQTKTQIITALEQALIKLDLNAITEFNLEKTKNISHGNLASNLPFLVASKYKKNPKEVADLIVSNLTTLENVDKIEATVSGYINFYLSSNIFAAMHKDVRKQRENYLRLDGCNDQYVIEVVSANPNGLLHIGHLRIGVVSDTIANLLRFRGKKVLCPYLINDVGTQIKNIVKSVWVKYKFLMYQTNYEELKDIKYDTQDAENCAKALINSKEYRFSFDSSLEDPVFYEELRSFVVNFFLDHIKEQLKLVNIEVDTWDSEKVIVTDEALQDVLVRLEKSIYLKDGALWFQTTKYDPTLTDDVIIKSNGDHTYFAQDMVYHAHKLNYVNKEGKILNVFAKDHSGHIKRLEAYFESINKPRSSLIHCQIELSKIIKDNKKEKISKRNNNMITLNDILEFMSYEEIRWFFICKDVGSPLDIDLDKLKEKGYNNPIFYVLYAYARIERIFNKIPNHDVFDRSMSFELLEDNLEKEMMNLLLSYEDVLNSAVKEHKPYYLCHFLFKLAQLFHSYYEKEKIIAVTEANLRNQRLALCFVIKHVIKGCLSILKIDAKSSL